MKIPKLVFTKIDPYGLLPLKKPDDEAVYNPVGDDYQVEFPVKRVFEACRTIYIKIDAPTSEEVEIIKEDLLLDVSRVAFKSGFIDEKHLFKVIYQTYKNHDFYVIRVKLYLIECIGQSVSSIPKHPKQLSTLEKTLADKIDSIKRGLEELRNIIFD